MNIKDLIIDYQTLIAIITFIAGLIGFYYRLKTEFEIGLAKIAMAVEEIKNDRKEKWIAQGIKCNERKLEYEKMARAQSEKDEKMEAYLQSISQGVNEMKIDIRELKTDVGWVKKK